MDNKVVQRIDGLQEKLGFTTCYSDEKEDFSTAKTKRKRYIGSLSKAK